MYPFIRNLVIGLLKTPPEPADPLGEEASLRVFRAAPGFWRYRRIGWIVSSVMIGLVSMGIEIAQVIALTASLGAVGALVGLLVTALLLAFAIGAIIVSYVTLRLDYEYRWYKVTDRSLRIREGVVFVREMTMTFANIQNIAVSQGPLQRLFGIADLKVETAGGARMGESSGQGQPAMFNMHVGWFRGVDNAAEIRDLMMARLRRLRDSGLGDLEEAKSAVAAGSATPGCGWSAAALDALRAAREEAHALRLTAEAASPAGAQSGA